MRLALLFYLMASVAALAQELHESENPRVTRIDSERAWTRDSSGTVWMLLKDPDISLCKWTGQGWEPHPLPTEMHQGDLRMHSDAEGRIWVFTGYQNQLVEIFDAKSGQWRNFSNLGDAYLALRKNPPHFSDEDLYLWIFDPQFSADGKRIAYREGVSDIYYYDGTAWQHLKRSQVTGKTETDNAVGPPWFGADGSLYVNIRRNTTWKMDATGKWSQIAYESHFPSDIWSEDDPGFRRPTPPEGAVTKNPESIVQDNLGMCWFPWQGDLYKAVPGRCVKAFSADEANPFHDIHDYRKVFVDSLGNVFLQTAAQRMEVYVIKPKSPPPQTTIVIDTAGADSVVAKFTTHSKLPVRYHWKLDDLPGRLSDDVRLTLDGLPKGSHQLSVSAEDTQLQMEANPATAVFQIKVDPQQQLASLITRLSDPDYDRRKAAVQALAWQPATAVPALQKARETVNEDQQWWIDAALQEIENEKAVTVSHQ